MRNECNDNNKNRKCLLNTAEPRLFELKEPFLLGMYSVFRLKK